MRKIKTRWLIFSGLLVAAIAFASTNRTLNTKVLCFMETLANGTNTFCIQSPDSLTASDTFTLPDGDGTNGQVIQTNGSGTLSWTSSLTNPMTAANDIIVGGTSGGATRVDTDLIGNAGASINTFTFDSSTDVNTTTDQITETSHALTTGDAIYLTTAGTLPTGLSENTKYYAIDAGANVFELATSFSNAFAGTQIDITGTGTGTHTLYYGGIDTPYSDTSGNPGLVTPYVQNASAGVVYAGSVTDDCTETIGEGTALTCNEAIYIRVGNIVTVSIGGSYTSDDATDDFEIEFDLPVTNTSAIDSDDCHGAGAHNPSVNTFQPVMIFTDTPSDTCRALWRAGAVGTSRTWKATYSYSID